MAEPSPGEPFYLAADPDAPGWYVGEARSGRFADIFGRVRLRADSETVARIRFTPGPQHRNLGDTVHGGYIMAVVDQVLFLGPLMLGIGGVMGGVTVSASTQFFAPLGDDRPFDAVVEVLRETGRMVFLRGLIEQAEVRAVSFAGTIRKAGTARAAPAA